MPNIHTPERLKDESQEQYKERRLQSKAHVDLITKPPRQEPYIKIPGTVQAPPKLQDWWSGQNTNSIRNVQRKKYRIDKKLHGKTFARIEKKANAPIDKPSLL